jgi:RTX calcium-binding nonapeptide repeat (4 copies)
MVTLPFNGKRVNRHCQELASSCTVGSALSAGGHRGRTFSASIAAATASLALLPGAASAGTISSENGRLAFAAAPGEANDLAITAGTDSNVVKDAGAPLTAGPGCQSKPDGSAECSVGAAVIVVDLGDMSDRLSLIGSLPSEVSGGAGDDTLHGGAGDDVIRGDAGNDTFQGNDGKDTLIGADGADVLAGDDGDDTLEGGPGNDALSGLDGNDTLTAGEGNDSLVGDRGNDRLEGGKGADSFEAGAGDDVLLGGGGEFKGTREKRIRCGAGDDSLTAGPADPFVSDCERIDGASLRLLEGGLIPFELECPTACKGTVRIRDAKNRINASARVNQRAGRTGTIQVRLTAAEAARLFQLKKARLTARFDLTSGGARQQARATFTLLRRI